MKALGYLNKAIDLEKEFRAVRGHDRYQRRGRASGPGPGPGRGGNWEDGDGEDGVSGGAAEFYKRQVIF